MDSAKKPIWLVFKNSEPEGSNYIVIFKAGDDLRQDMLTLQLLRVMDKLWKNRNLNLRLNAYQCIVTGKDMGMIEVVTDAMTIAKIQKANERPLSELSSEVLYDWLCQHNKTPSEIDNAIQNFTHSCAGYCVATYLLGIGDRHNDNIMLKKDGHFFHIDFGHFLGNFKNFLVFKRERVPVVFTPEMAYVIKEKKSRRADSENYVKFIEFTNRAHGILQENGILFINLFALMLTSGMPELQKVDDIRFLCDTLSTGNFHTDILDKTGAQVSTRVNFVIHNIVH
jgi:phosphatidylinositol-4,5-bisphosphate 3-kinase